MKQSDAFDVEDWAAWIAEVEGIPYKEALAAAKTEYATCEAEGIDLPGPVKAFTPSPAPVSPSERKKPKKQKK